MTTGADTPKTAEPVDMLLKDYDNAVQLTYHIDTLRDRVTVFFVTVAGIAAAGLSVVLKDPAASSLALDLVAALFLLVAALGCAVVVILARLRAVQLEHFRILTKIRQRFYGKDMDLWNAVELSGSTLPQERRSSGTYAWLALILIVTAFAAGAGTYLLVRVGNDWLSNGVAWGLVAVFGIVLVVALDRVYLRLAKAPDAPVYSTTAPPTSV